MPADALQLAVAAVNAGQIADRGVLEHNLRRIVVLLQAPLDFEQLPAPIIVLEVLLEQGEVGAHHSPVAPAMG